MTQPDAVMLHAALMAKARGFKGFIHFMNPRMPTMALIMFGNTGDAEMSAPFYCDADAVIAELRQIIPSPEELEARRKARAK